MWRAETMKAGLASVAAISLALAVPAAAQDGEPSGKRPTVSRNAPPSSNSTINLINLLVKQGVLGEEQAATLIKQADDEAYVVRQAVRDAAAKADGADKRASTAADAVSPPGTKRVTYVPEIVKQQLREDIKRDVMAKAEKENWASPGKYPEWAQRIRFSGDIRTRYEGIFYPRGNAIGWFPNFNAINTGSPFDVSDISNPNFYPSYNVEQNRNRARLRARLGMEADLFENFSAGLRIGTGDSNSPVSFNQTLGGSGGNFSKYAVWIDRAFIKYSAWNELTIQAGRFDNPFFNVNDLVYHRDLGFDGIAFQARHEVMPGYTPFIVAGAFPTFNTALDAGSNFAKLPSNDKWMFGVQVGGAFRPDPEVELTVGGAVYEFTNAQGQLSNPCPVVTSADTCNTDLTRPSFAHRGNTYMALRSIAATPFNNFATESLYQYFGLASKFRPAVASARLDLGHFNPVHIILEGEYVRNLAWNRNDVANRMFGLNSTLPAGNGIIPLGPTMDCPSAPCPNVYTGGNQGWLARMTVGYPKLRELWDWNAHVGYKYLESDAVIDAFADSDFGLGGTNLKGYFIGGNVALGPNVWASMRWMSANQVAGAPYAVDIVQLDLNARF